VVVGFAGLFVTCAILKSEALLKQISIELGAFSVDRVALSLHFALLTLFGALSVALYAPGINGLAADTLTVAWFSAGLAAIAFGALSFVPWRSGRLLVKNTGYLWLQVLIAVIVACAGGNGIRYLWEPAAHATFGLTNVLLRPFFSGVTADSVHLLIGTDRFSVTIAKECSGLEGIGLILAFTCLWLVLFRREFRFPRALVLFPAGVLIMFLLNGIRIAALIAIGNAGAERIAVGGFHSQAGWMAFNALAIGIALGARKIPWLVNATAPRAKPRVNFTAVFLAPFLAILAAGMLSVSASAGFEWLYPLRFVAAACALWYFREYYANLGWRCTWFGPFAGICVFALWISLDRSQNLVMPAALAAVSPASRALWIAFRVLAAVVTVPIAEELAFRGYVYRKLIAREFQSVTFARFAWPALIVSSILFGLMHGNRWLAGTAAGLFYATAMIRRGRIADAIVAHATTNALLAGYVLATGKWQYW
jgi:exosortase E/protease (VPEID-CTERM system)